MGRGKDITKEQKEQIRRAFESDGIQGALIFGRTLGRAARTVYRVCQESRPVPRQRMGPVRKWTPEQVRTLVEHVEESPCETLQELSDWAVGQGMGHVCLQTIANYLEGELITYKVARREPDARNSPSTKASRREYASWFLSDPGREYIYIDETGISLWTTRGHGRARRGVTPAVLVSAQRGVNKSVVMAICERHGILHSMIRSGSFNAGTFIEFMRELAHIVQERAIPSPVFVMDNCRVHSRADLERLEAETGISTRFLPPWSPMLNPIEGVFGDFKSIIRTLLTTEYREMILEISGLPYGQKTRRRTELLEEAYATALTRLPVTAIHGHCRGLLTAIGLSMEGADQ